jgi:hypothetical protein
MNLTSLSSFATSAFDSARSNLKQMAEAAKTAPVVAEPAAVPSVKAATPIAEAVRAAEAVATSPAPINKRLGLALDAYA